MALERLVETVLSGPAASVVGRVSSPGRTRWMVIDMGGATTDIALLEAGVPALSQEGATVGGWQTMVEAVQVHTSGLGGDSGVRLDGEACLAVGPRRIVPLSLLVEQISPVLVTLRSQWEQSNPHPLDANSA
ncbi:MAG: hydantoinase/oxoprolinase family protein [Anaerolineales bacterium]|nr:hydantoinase/oxoprolinase family protein [Anaerolineales bacterium]